MTPRRTCSLCVKCSLLLDYPYGGEKLLIEHSALFDDETPQDCTREKVFRGAEALVQVRAGAANPFSSILLALLPAPPRGITRNSRHNNHRESQSQDLPPRGA